MTNMMRNHLLHTSKLYHFSDLTLWLIAFEVNILLSQLNILNICIPGHEGLIKAPTSLHERVRCALFDDTFSVCGRRHRIVWK